MPATSTRSRWAGGSLLFSNLTERLSPLYTITKNLLIADVNAGVEVLPAVPGIAYRMVDCTMVAYTGAVGTVTTIDVLGTQTSGVKLVAYAQGSLTQSTVLRAGGTGAAVLADGASYAVCDAGTAITVGITGSAADTADGVILVLKYAMEHA